METLTEEQKKRQAYLAGVTEMPEHRQISMRINGRLHELFKARVSLEGRTIGDVIENLINRYVEGKLDD
jgi:hypothetical protein